MTTPAPQTASRTTLGYAFAVLQAVLYSSMGIACKIMLGTGMNTAQVMLLRFGLTSIILCIIILIYRKERLFSRKPATYVAGVFFFFGAYLYFVGVDYLTAGMATVLFYTYPAVVAIESSLVFREKPTAFTLAALGLTLVGIFLISGVWLPGEVVMDPFGILMTVLACLSFATYSVILQWIGRRYQGKVEPDGSKPEGSLTSTFNMAIMSLAISLIAFGGEVPGLFTLDLGQWGLGLFMALFNTIVPIVLYTLAIRWIGATQTSLIGTSETPCSLLLAFLLLGETFSLGQGIGALLIISAVVIVALFGTRKKPAKT